MIQNLWARRLGTHPPKVRVVAGQVRKYVAQDVSPPQGKLELDGVGVTCGTSVATYGLTVVAGGTTVVTEAAGLVEDEKAVA